MIANNGNSKLAYDFILPHVLRLASDSNPTVRCEALRTLALVVSLHSQEGNPQYFVSYLIPAIRHLVEDVSTAVRITFAEVLPDVALAGRRSLERHWRPLATTVSSSSSTGDQPSFADAARLQRAALRRKKQSQVSKFADSVEKLLSRAVQDECNDVRVALLARTAFLAEFFGRKRTDEFLLPWLITLVNHRGSSNWTVRQMGLVRAFSNVGSFVGPIALHRFLFPLVLEIIKDEDENPRVISNAMESISTLIDSKPVD